MNCRLTRHCIPQVPLAVFVCGGLIALFVWLAAGSTGWWAWLAAALVPAAVLGWVLWFFRDPDREIPDGQGELVSPADGRVTDVTLLGEDCVLGREATQVGVFMSIFSVHVNRAPAAGVIRSVFHQDGAFLDARDPHASEKNEATTIHMSISVAGREYPLVFRQIAGLVARRIVTAVRVDEHVRRGQRIGMIKFGSRCELIVPRELVGRVRVTPGEHVRAGASVLVEIARPS